MAKNRKRFYILLLSNGGREIISLKGKPELNIILTSSYPANNILGPYHTFSDACIGMENIKLRPNTIRKARSIVKAGYGSHVLNSLKQAMIIIQNDKPALLTQYVEVKDLKGLVN